MASSLRVFRCPFQHWGRFGVSSPTAGLSRVPLKDPPAAAEGRGGDLAGKFGRFFFFFKVLI